MDPHSFFADPDKAVFLSADPDLTKRRWDFVQKIPVPREEFASASTIF